MATYTIERVYQTTPPEVFDFLVEEIPKISERFSDKFNWRMIDLEQLLKDKTFFYCTRNGEVVGFILCTFMRSTFDPTNIVLMQDLFYVKPNSGKAAYLLFKKFIDIGKSKANHIITMLTSQTNVKPSTLKKFAFKELETLYRLEV